VGSEGRKSDLDSSRRQVVAASAAILLLVVSACLALYPVGGQVSHVGFEARGGGSCAPPLYEALNYRVGISSDQDLGCFSEAGPRVAWSLLALVAAVFVYAGSVRLFGSNRRSSSIFPIVVSVLLGGFLVVGLIGSFTAGL